MERDRRGQRIVVLGGGGFLGSHVSERLVAEGAAGVAGGLWGTRPERQPPPPQGPGAAPGGAPPRVAVDSGAPGRERNLEPIEGRGALEVVTADAAEIEVDGPVTAILHLASPASPPDYLRFPTETLRAGSVATLHAIDLAHAHGARL